MIHGNYNDIGIAKPVKFNVFVGSTDKHACMSKCHQFQIDHFSHVLNANLKCVEFIQYILHSNYNYAPFGHNWLPVAQRNRHNGRAWCLRSPS